MSSIEKFISPFVSQQFPAFYRDQGKNFVAFVRAYYEWMEQAGGTVRESRSLLDYADIDSTTDQFIEYFKSQYIQSLPDSSLVDKRLLIKNVLDLYRSKGSPRAVELLFRVVFGEDIELYVPNEYVFRPSDNTWKVPRYIEVTSHPRLNDLVGTQIQNVGNTAVAIVETVSKRIVGGRTINVLEITPVRGVFTRSDRVYQTSGESISAVESVSVTGSLTAIAISQGGRDFAVGDFLDVLGSGREATARVSAVSDAFAGALNFTIADGGSGYTTNAVVTVKSTLNLNISGTLGTIDSGDTVVDSVTGANGTVFSSNSTVLRLIDFTTSPTFAIGSKAVSASGNATITRVLGGVGSGGSFRVGSLSDRENITFNNTAIEPYLALELDSSSNTMELAVSSVSGTFSVGDEVTSTANVVYLEGFTSSVTEVANGESLSNSTLGIVSLYVYRSDGPLVFCTGSEADLTNANLVSGAVLVSNSSSSVFQLINTPTKETSNGVAIVEASNSTTVTVGSVNGYFVETSTLVDSNTAATATIDDVTRLTDWNFDGSVSVLDNLDSTIADSLPLTTLEVGTIASLAQVNPGSGYLTTPYITVVEPAIASLLLLDSELTQKGNNAIIASTIAGGNGTITSVEIVDSGVGYVDNEGVTLVSLANPSLVNGSAIVYRAGKSRGRWLNRKSFPSDVIYLQDGLFYQDYSYQVIAQRMLSSYEKLVRDLVHPSGVALFGAFRVTDYVVDDQDTVTESSITQQ